MKIANKKDKNEEKLEKLELGFNTYVNGAHKTAEKYTPRHTTSKSSLGSSDKNYNFCLKPRIHVRKNPIDNLRQLEFLANKDRAKSASTETARKKWSNTSFTIKTSDGYDIKINAPNSCRKNHVSNLDMNNSKITATKKKIKKLAKKTSNSEKITNNSNDCEYYYSDDFISDDSISSDCDESNIKNDKFNQDLIQSVKFSDVSDDDNMSSGNENEGKLELKNKEKNNKKISLKLSTNDVKVSRIKQFLIYEKFILKI